MSLSRLLAAASFLLPVFSYVSAQDLPDVAQGLQPYGAYHGGNLDQVSLLNGGLTVRIPLVSYPQKGSLSLSYSIVYNSFGYEDQIQCLTADPSGQRLAGPVDCTDDVSPISSENPKLPALTGPRLVTDQRLYAAGSSAPDEGVQASGGNAPVVQRFFVIDSDNSHHPVALGSDGIYHSVNEDAFAFALSPSDSSSNYAQLNGWISRPVARIATGEIRDKKGNIYSTTSDLSAANTITDLDGNTIILGSSEDPSSAQDSMGRNIPAPFSTTTDGCPILEGTSQTATNAQLWNPPGQGQNGVITYKLCFAAVTWQTELGFNVGNPTLTNEPRHTVSMLQSIVLPNGTHWGFIYETSLGQLSKLIYPTGGWVQYSYGLTTGTCDSGRIGSTAPDGVSVVTHIPVVTGRSMYDSAGTLLASWTYSAADAGTGKATVIANNSQLTEEVAALGKVCVGL